MTTEDAHWDAVYGARTEAALTWFEADPRLSLRWITAFADHDDPVIDIGGGASRLMDALLDLGYARPSYLDLSQAALAVSRARLGARGESVTWIVADVTRWDAPHAAYALWHDRAAFHFLTAPGQRAAYVARMAQALRPGGHAVIMTFAEDGPDRCSGLPVWRTSSKTLADEIALHAPGAFVPVTSARHLHRTPTGAEQPFQTLVLRRA